MNNKKTGIEYRDVKIGNTVHHIEVPGSGTWEHEQSTWVFTKEDADRNREYVDQHGWAKYKEPDALQGWLKEFEHCRVK